MTFKEQSLMFVFWSSKAFARVLDHARLILIIRSKIAFPKVRFGDLHLSKLRRCFVLITPIADITIAWLSETIAGDVRNRGRERQWDVGRLCSEPCGQKGGLTRVLVPEG